MKKLLLILLMFVSLQGFTQVVKLTDGEPAWVPNYLIVQGNLYFLEGTTYTSLGDSLSSYVRRSELVDSLGNYVSRFELVDSLNNYVSRLELVDSLTNYVARAELVDSLSGYVSRTELVDSLTPYGNKDWVRNEIHDSLALFSSSPWDEVAGGISYDNSITVGDTLKLKGIIDQHRTYSIPDAGDNAFYYSNDTIEAGANLVTNTYAHGERHFSRFQNTGGYTTAELQYWPYARDSKLYTDAENYYGAYYSSATFDGGVSGYYHGFANYVKHQMTDGGSHTIGNYHGFYNGVRGIQGGGSTLTIPEYVGFYNDMDVSVGVAGGVLNTTNLYGIKNLMDEDVDITHNITNAYGLWLGGSFRRADNLYGIYEDLGQNYFESFTNINDSLWVADTARFSTPIYINGNYFDGSIPDVSGQIHDSLVNYVSRSELVDTLNRYADTAWVQNQIADSLAAFQGGSYWTQSNDTIYTENNVIIDSSLIPRNVYFSDNAIYEFSTNNDSQEDTVVLDFKRYNIFYITRYDGLYIDLISTLQEDMPYGTFTLIIRSIAAINDEINWKYPYFFSGDGIKPFSVSSGTSVYQLTVIETAFGRRLLITTVPDIYYFQN